MKKFLLKGCAAAVSVMTLISVSGCGGEKDAASEEIVNDEPIKFTYWAEMPDSLVSQFSTMADMTLYQKLKELTNVEIEFKHPPAGQAKEQFNLMMASRDLTDVVEYNWGVYGGGPEQALADNVIYRLNDTMEENAPNFTRALKENPIYDKQSKTDSNDYYGFPSFNTGKYRTFGGFILRKDWLDELGLETPETLAEWENVLTQFKEKKGARAPLTAKNDFLNKGYGFNCAFNVGMSFYIDNGKVKFGPMEPGFQEFLSTMRSWYEKGLLDNEYTTNNNVTVDGRMTNGESGACYGFIGSTIGRYMTSMEGRDPNYDLVAAQHPVKNKGDEPLFMEVQKEANIPFAAITTKCKNPKRAMQWIDYLYSEEGNLLKNYGVEGFTYTMENGVPTYTDEILKNPEGLSISEAMIRHFRANPPAPGFNQDENYLKQYYQLQQQKDALDVWSKFADKAAQHIMPPVTPKVDESEELTSIMSEINTYVSEMCVKYVNGAVPMDQYPEFVNALKNMKIERAIAIQQAAYDRYQNR